jgi:hypothetical protein
MPIELAMSAEMRDLFQCLDPKMPLPSTSEQLKDILNEQSIEIRQCLNGELAAFKGSLSSIIGVWRIEEPFGLYSTYVTGNTLNLTQLTQSCFSDCPIYQRRPIAAPFFGRAQTCTKRKCCSNIPKNPGRV